MRHVRFSNFGPLALLVALSVLAQAVLVGCGGGDSPSSGKLRLIVKWPEPSRLIPVASSSINAVLTSGSTTLGTQLLVRPSQAPWTTTVTFPSLAPGTVMLTATAYPNADGTGIAQAVGHAPATISSGKQSQVTVMMNSTIVRLAVTPNNPTINVGATQALTMTAYDAQDQVVMTSPQNVTWNSATPGVASVSSSGVATGVSAGTSQVTASESESQKTSPPITVTVQVPAGCQPGTITGPGGLASTPWPKALGPNLKSTGVAIGSVSSTKPSLLWSATIGSSGVGGVAIAPDGTLYVGSFWDHKLYAVDGSSGAVKWSFTADQGIVGTPAIASNGNIFVGSGFSLYGLDPSGNQLWTRSFQTSCSPTTGLDGYVYVAGAQSMSRVNPTNGSLDWNVSSGQVGWPYAAPPLAADGSVYAGGFIGGGTINLFAMDGKCGTTKWKTPISVNAMSIGADGTIYATADYSVNVSTKVVAVNPADGSIKWTAANIPVQPSPPAVGPDGTVYVIGVPGIITALDPATGATKWQYTVPSPLPAGTSTLGPLTIAANGKILFTGNYRDASNNHLAALFCLDTSTGSEVWRYDIAGGVADECPVTVDDQGTIYFRDGGTSILYALR